MTAPVTIYHNPKCGTARKTLELIRASGIEPAVVLYLETPPTRETLTDFVRRLPGGARELLRQKEPLAAEMHLENPALSEQQLIDAMMQHPILINRPVVISDKGLRLCRPPESVLDLL